MNCRLTAFTLLPVRAEEFQRYIDVLPYGKTLPEARYIFRPEGSSLSESFLTIVKRAECAASPLPTGIS